MLFEFNTFFPKQCFRPIHRAERREKRLIGNVVRLLAPVAGTIASVPIESAAAYVGQVKTSRVSDFVADRLGLLEAFFCLVQGLVFAVKIPMFRASKEVFDHPDRQYAHYNRLFASLFPLNVRSQFAVRQMKQQAVRETQFVHVIPRFHFRQLQQWEVA